MHIVALNHVQILLCCIYLLGACCPIFCVPLFYYYCSFTAQCPELPLLLNGFIRYGPLDFTSPYDIGTLASHSCNLGFRLVGVETRVCQLTMDWSEEAPVCERKINL